MLLEIHVNPIGPGINLRTRIQGTLPESLALDRGDNQEIETVK